MDIPTILTVTTLLLAVAGLLLWQHELLRWRTAEF